MINPFKRGFKLKFKESYFVKTWGLIKKNPKNSLLIILFDVLFLASVSVLYGLISSLISEDIEATKAIMLVYLVLILLYYLGLVFLYSFFKYLVLNSIKSFFEHFQTKFKLLKGREFFAGLKKFYLLNLLTFAVFFTGFLILNSLFLMSTKQEYAPYIFLTINLPFFLILYIFINISHTLFSEFKEVGMKEVVRNTFRTVAKIKAYAGIFLMNIAAIIVYFIVFYFIGLVLKATIFKGYMVSIQPYNMIFAIITNIFLYLILFFNRIYFYNVIKNKE